MLSATDCQPKSGDEKPITINNFSGLCREWVGDKQRKLINQILRKSQENAGMD